jgi:cytochrome c biogenesis protein
LASRGRLGRWGSTIVHVSLLIIMLGGIMAELGFVGTHLMPVGESTKTYFDWDVEQDMSLGFELRVDHFELDYYPIELKVGIYNPQTRELMEEHVTKEGETFPLPLDGGTATVVNFEPFDKSLTLEVYRNGQKVADYRGLPGDSKEEVSNFLDDLIVIKPRAFRDPILKQTLTDVSILENGEVVKQQRIMINHPLVYRGVAIYQTGMNQDEFGFWYVGFQISKDPGEPLVWGGSILLVLGLYIAFFIRYRVVVVTAHGVTPILGFNDPAGHKILEELNGTQINAEKADKG